MQRIGQAAAGFLAMGAAIADVMRQGLLAAVHVDGGDAMAGIEQVDGQVEGGGRLARTALLVAHYNDMRPITRHRRPQISACTIWNAREGRHG